MNMDLAQEHCVACEGGVPPLPPGEVQQMLGQLTDWQLADDGRSIRRRFAFKGFLKAVEMANLAAWVGNKQNHHPDITFGYGYCEVAYTTHAADGLTRNDFICAARLDALVG
ncbi:4a-hydroxytetrahydrobiopterin dehydratase [Paracoccus homiensis]|uniref:4a-hydroxytetrahydrobiopterin dehydratase n=1 Tax=Paracoccus homiensis TaxID=364199 RepID=UPI00398CCF68